MRSPKSSVTKRWEWRRFHVSERYLRIIALVAVVLIVTLVFVLRDQLPTAETIAYPAIFLISLFSSASVVIPVPGILSVCSGGAMLNPLFVGLVAGLAEGLGELTGYLAGFSGRGVLSSNRIYQRIQPWMQRRGWVVVLVFASIPNPLFDLVGLAAGAARIPVVKFLGAAWAGKTIKSTAVAYGCALGYDFFLQFSERFG
ncbi:MAG: VTT domain-containing protein [Dehalococcoidia bacterium]